MKEWTLKHSFYFEGREVKYDIKGEGKPVILVHGTPWSSFNLRHLISELSLEYKVYYFDLLGYGSSDKSDADVSLGIQNRLLDEIIKYWELKNPFIIGHDFGGTTVFRNHILNKKNYKKIVVIDPVALSPWGSPFFKHIEKHENAFSTVPDFIHLAIVEAYIKTAAHKKLTQETIHGILAPWSSKEGKAAFYRQIAQADSKFTDEFQDRFDEIRAPLLILWGQEDKWIPCSQAYELQKKIKKAQLITIPDAGHLIIEEKPQILVQEIKKFFESEKE
ncbi:alpha/beta fold hydrolase [Halarcobacter anaerophilus]|uniref:Alpha/beta hydrolase n=1 Tax=Halarcobacter anaerophilus TaxID=877500 RepID=A0A4Q0Y115_9BACT|nr:alpha/beta hydrolase [Halarcobacter anaerophilus]QDF29118.1 alpha/beta hydrolase family protein [Halarcobacter anaerophilus]RXJ63746.1 alpha/beta hydrolase [Halarcobacter anaerophilus]